MRERNPRRGPPDRPDAPARSLRVPLERRVQADGVGSLRVLTAAIAHEVNQPLSAIVTNADACLRMLSADPPNLAGARETVRRTMRDVNRVADVIGRLRALFANSPIAALPVDLNDTVAEALEMCRAELVASRVEVRCDLAEQLPAVAGDRIQFQQVILNLLRNAADAMAGLHGRGREIAVVTRRDAEGHVHLSVRDAGTGFRGEDADHLFAPFYTTKAHGMGIGLSLSRSIVERHGGRLWGMPNDDGPGATFALWMPAGSHGPVHAERAFPHFADVAGAVAYASRP